MKSAKATRSQVRRHNRQLILRMIFEEVATNRAALSLETGLTKPAVSDLVNELMDEGLLVEEGFGESTDSGGKRPRLLRFVPDARQVIGISINSRRVLGVLTNLDGYVVAEHVADLPEQQDVSDILVEVVNGLIAQLSAPLLCIGVGITAVVDSEGQITFAPYEEWRDLSLGDVMRKAYEVPVYISNNTELVARAQYAFGNVGDSPDLVTVQVGTSVGIGAVMTHSVYHLGSQIGHLKLNGHKVEDRLGWKAVRERAFIFGDANDADWLRVPDLTYLHIRYAVSQGDPAAKAFQSELADDVAQIFAWVIAIFHPSHVSLSGAIANLGEVFLAETIACTRAYLLSELVDMTVFSLDDTPNLTAIGAAAKAVQRELGLV